MPTSRISEHPVVACHRGLDSLDAVQLGARFARLLNEPLVLATAYEYEPVALSARALVSTGNERRAQAARATLDRARAFVADDVDVREQLVPAVGTEAGLLGLARDVDASVIVVGPDTTGHVTRSLVPRAPCPVAVARSSVPLPPPGPITRVGVAYDGSPHARLALAAATTLARAAGARLVVLAAAATAQRAAAPLEHARALLDREHERSETLALVGDPGPALARASADYDLLVCGSRGRGRSLSALLGSVSSHLLAHARCPLLVVPPLVHGEPSGPLGVTCAAAADR